MNENDSRRISRERRRLTTRPILAVVNGWPVVADQCLEPRVFAQWVPCWIELENVNGYAAEYLQQMID